MGLCDLFLALLALCVAGISSLGSPEVSQTLPPPNILLAQSLVGAYALPALGRFSGKRPFASKRLQHKSAHKPHSATRLCTRVARALSLGL